MADAKISALTPATAVASADQWVIVQSGVTKVATGADVWSRVASIAFTDGSGLDFSGTEGSGATSSVLGDYEEGAWTPVLSDGTTVITSTSVNATYTKIGNSVSLRCYITASNLNGLTSESVRITGLPYTASGFTSGGIGYSTDINITLGHTLAIYLHSSSYIALQVWDSPSGLSGLRADELSADGRVMIALTYEV